MIAHRVCLVLLALLLGNTFSKCVGQDLPAPDDVPPSPPLQVRVELVDHNLQDLAGIAIRPGGTAERYEIFVLVRATGNVVRFNSHKPAETANAITGFQLAQLGSGEKVPPGVSALAFLDQSHLLVMSDPSDDGRHSLRIFELPTDGESLVASEPQQEILSTPHPSHSAAGEQLLYGITRDAQRVYLCCVGSQFAISQASLQGNALGDITVWATAEPGDEPSGAACVTVNSRRDKGYVVAGIPAATPQQSRLVFYHPVTAERLLSLPIPLLEVAGLAYGPSSGLLYAIDVARRDEARGGVYRLDAGSAAGRQTCTAVAIAPLVRPTAMVFGPDSTLYVIAHNQADPQESSLSRLYRVRGHL
jgi:hypothetical protein